MPAQKITIEDALVAYSRGSAYAAFEEQQKGTIAPGKLADLVIVDKDLRKIPGPEIRSARVVRPLVGGRTVYSRSPEAAARHRAAVGISLSRHEL